MKFCTADFETSLIADGEQVFLCGGLTDGVDYFYFEDIKKFLNTLIRNQYKTIFFHNLSYDFRFILSTLDNLGFNYDITVRGSNVLRVTVFSGSRKLFEFRDSLALLPLSLKSLCKDLNHKSYKLDFNISKIETLFIENKELVKRYLYFDVVALHEALCNFKSLLGVDRFKLTISSMALAQFKQTYPRWYNSTYNIKHDSLFRKSIFGGRTEVFKLFSEDANYYDVNSLYPYVMSKYSFPCGKFEKIDNYNHYPHYIADVSITIPDSEYIPCIPVKTPVNGTTKLIFPVGKVRGIYNDVDISLARLCGYGIRFNKIWGFRDEEFIFRDYINKYYSIKQRGTDEGNNSLKLIGKLFLNSCYGKFAEKPKSVEFKRLSNAYEVGELIKMKSDGLIDDVEVLDSEKFYVSITKGRNQNYTFSIIASYILSYARMELFNLLRESHLKECEVYYCDTDSIITTNKFKTGSHLGELKLEDKIKEGVYALPKLYSYINSDGDEVVKVKGINSDNLTYTDIYNFVKNDVKIVNSKVRVCKIRRILKGYDAPTQCRKITKEIKFNADSSKRNVHRLINTTPLKI